jgi:hypothetical protein
MVGKIAWRSISDDKQKYFIYGKQICPSEQCPWDEAGILHTILSKHIYHQIKEKIVQLANYSENPK